MSSDPSELRAYDRPLPGGAVPAALAADAFAEATAMLTLRDHTGWRQLKNAIERGAQSCRERLATGFVMDDGKSRAINDQEWQYAQAYLSAAALLDQMPREAEMALVEARAAMARTLKREAAKRRPAPAVRSEKKATEILRDAGPFRSLAGNPSWKKFSAWLVQRAWAHRKMASQGTREDAEGHRAAIQAIRAVLDTLQEKLDKAASAEAFMAAKEQKQEAVGT